MFFNIHEFGVHVCKNIKIVDRDDSSTSESIAGFASRMNNFGCSVRRRVYPHSGVCSFHKSEGNLLSYETIDDRRSDVRNILMDFGCRSFIEDVILLEIAGSS